ncbi:MAG: hypothetical protein M3454_04870 [Actinomycetota bacterium]|nr:hypothetical protein [Actinomycetota bacterium]
MSSAGCSSAPEGVAGATGPLRYCSSRVGVVEQVAAAHYAATDEPIGAAVAETSSRPRRAPH